MIVSIVEINVMPEYAKEFVKATKINVERSNKEDGVFRFDFVRHKLDPNHYFLLEYFYDESAQISHKHTEHYLLWKQIVEKMLERPRSSILCDDVAMRK